MNTPMTVKSLIEFLQTQRQDMPVVFEMYSELCEIDFKSITVQKHCLPRQDGWVHRQRPDKPEQEYLVFPGN